MTYDVTLHRLDAKDFIEVWGWCEDHIGPVWRDNTNKDYKWSLTMTMLFGTVIFCFNDEDDATLFKLRWLK